MSTAASVKMQKIGVRYRPPTIFLFYIDTKTGKLRRRTVLLSDFTAATDITDYAKELHNDRITKNRNLFRYVPLRRLERLLFVIKEGQKGNPSKGEIEKKLRQFDQVDENEDLNKLDDEALKHKKLIMEETFEKNFVDPKSADFVYDVEVDFEPESEEQQASGWDSDEEIQEDIQKDDGDPDDDEDDDFK